MFLLLLASSSNGEVRKWTRKNGKEFQAEFVKLEKDKEGHNTVTLRRPNGKEMTVRLGNLSEDDRNYIKQQVGSQAKPQTKDAGEHKPADQSAFLGERRRT